MLHLSTADSTDMAELFEAVGAGIIVFDISKDQALQMVYSNRIYRAMHDIGHEPAVGSMIHDFMPRYIQKQYRKQFQECYGLRASVDQEHPLEIQGEGRWYRVRMFPVFDEPGEKGHITRILATSVDITEHKKLQDELNIANSRFKAIIESTHDAIVSIDDQFRIKTFNLAAEELFGYEREEVIGKNLDILLPESVRPQHGDHVKSFAKSPVQSRPMESRVEVAGLRKDGNVFPAEVAIAKIMVHGEMEFTAIVRDISVKMRLLKELEMRATTDPLTGISNRRHLVEVAEVEVDRCERYGHPVSLLLFDIDDFKMVNDTHGHAVGDKVLQAIGKLLQSRARKLDISARWGGEEFCLLMPETAIENAREMANRLLKDISAIEVSELKGHIITASIGLASYCKSDGDLYTFVHYADKAMYEAKHTGKNRICLAAAR